MAKDPHSADMVAALDAPDGSLDVANSTQYIFLHPLVCTHPENGRRALYLNPVRIESIIGLEDDDALALVAQIRPSCSIAM